jgi:hypothetical protein
MTDAAPLYEEVQKGWQWGVVALVCLCLVNAAGGLYVYSLKCSLSLPASMPFYVGMAVWWGLMSLVLLWAGARGYRVTIRADEDGLKVMRGGGGNVPLRLPYPNIAAVEAAPRREWWWKRVHGLFAGTMYFAFGRRPAGAVRILLKEEAATRTRRVITIGTDNPEELADFLRERIESNDDGGHIARQRSGRRRAAV